MIIPLSIAQKKILEKSTVVLQIKAEKADILSVWVLFILRRACWEMKISSRACEAYRACQEKTL